MSNDNVDLGALRALAERRALDGKALTIEQQERLCHLALALLAEVEAEARSEATSLCDLE